MARRTRKPTPVAVPRWQEIAESNFAMAVDQQGEPDYDGLAGSLNAHYENVADSVREEKLGKDARALATGHFADLVAARFPGMKW
jgi:hypothetical protein